MNRRNEVLEEWEDLLTMEKHAESAFLIRGSVTKRGVKKKLHGLKLLSLLIIVVKWFAFSRRLH